MTAPYLPAAAAAITRSVGHYAVLTARPRTGSPFVLAVEDDQLEVTFSEDWSPHVQLAAGCAVPSQALMDALDPRLRCRVTVDAGYVYGDGTVDVHPLADVALISRHVTRPANTLEVTGGSDEYLAQGFAKMWPEFDAPTTSLADAVTWLAGHSVAPTVPTVTSDFPAGMGSYMLRELETPIGVPFWDIIADAAQRCSAWVYCDGARVWRVAEKAGLSTPDLVLSVGEDGTVLDSDTTLDREGWANAVIITYEWESTDGTRNKILGRAIAASGDFNNESVGRKLHMESRRLHVTQDQADAAAAGLLRQLISRGRGLTLTAHAAYWLRPGMTVAVTLPTGGTENHLVKSVSFRPFAGTMTVETRQPVTTTITTGE